MDRVSSLENMSRTAFSSSPGGRADPKKRHAVGAANSMDDHRALEEGRLQMKTSRKTTEPVQTGGGQNGSQIGRVPLPTQYRPFGASGPLAKGFATALNQKSSMASPTASRTLPPRRVKTSNQPSQPHQAHQAQNSQQARPGQHLEHLRQLQRSQRDYYYGQPLMEPFYHQFQEVEITRRRLQQAQ